MGEWHGIELSGLTLTGARLTLRPFVPADVEPVFAGMQDATMPEFVPIAWPYTRDDARTWVLEESRRGPDDGRAVRTGMIETASGRLVGACGLRLPVGGGASGEIGFTVYPWGRGHGYAAEATRLLTEWGFAAGLARVQVRAVVTNLASIRTALAAGFRYEGIARSDLATARGQRDGAVFGRTADDPSEPVSPVFPALPHGGLGDGVVVLRPTEPRDAELILAYLNETVTRRWSIHPDPPTADEARRRVERAGLQWLVGPKAALTICDTPTGATVGFIEVRQDDVPGVANIGYGLLPEWRGHGRMARALRLTTEWAFATGYRRLQLGTAVANVASQRVAAAAGFAREGVARGFVRQTDGTDADDVTFALLRTD